LPLKSVMPLVSGRKTHRRAISDLRPTTMRLTYALLKGVNVLKAHTVNSTVVAKDKQLREYSA